MVATQSGVHRYRESPKGLQMDRLMDVWTDEDGGAYMKGMKKNISLKKKGVFLYDCISLAV